MMFRVTVIPWPELIKGLFSSAALTTWIIYWVMLGNYIGKPKRHAQLLPQELYSGYPAQWNHLAVVSETY